MKEINRLKEKREEKQRAIDSYKGMREKVEIISPYLFLNRSTMNQQVRIEKGNGVLNLSICSIKDLLTLMYCAAGFFYQTCFNYY